MAVARLASVALDCADPLPLAAFWAHLLGGQIAATSDAVVAVRTDRGWLMALRVPGYAAPAWPEGAIPKQIHLDLAVDDLDAAEAEAIGLGGAQGSRAAGARPVAGVA